ncbi:hypothetical protein HQN88_06665 [Paenibacillus qinlingensis]|nr:hypothetical protein [Paenibacillus qinlingensis]
MTAKWARIPWDVLEKISVRIVYLHPNHQLPSSYSD